jgi:transcriptional regulator with XRE-family HTH domain
MVKRSTFPLRVARALAEVSQRQLGARSGLSEKIIWAIENGYRVPSAAERQAIAEALATTVASIAWPAGR